MRLPFPLAMARRELRSGGKRLRVYIASITFGVAALVGIGSFRSNIESAVAREARTLLGADLELSSRRPFPEPIRSVLDSATAAGVPVAHVTRFASMALAPASGTSRLVQVRALDGEYPFYGDVETEPAGLWERLRSTSHLLVDPAVLIQLDASIGDTLAIGEARFRIAGTVTRVPGDIGIRAAIGPRVYLPADRLEETGLIRFGSLARFHAYLKLSGATEARTLLERYGPLLETHQVGHDTVEETETELAGALDRLASFLGLVGLVALLLGGLGVASGVRVFVDRRLDTVALLRCLGARQRGTFAVYLIIAGLMGVAGAALGLALGILVQAGLPIVVQDFLPLEIPFRIRPAVLLAGLLAGIGVSLLFALLPLLRVRDVPPLRALRRDVEPTPAFDRIRIAVIGGILTSAAGLALWQAPDLSTGLAFAGGVLVSLLALAGAALALMQLARRLPASPGYAVRQGLANLFRPRNQTLAVTVALGFGVFLLGTLASVETTLLGFFATETRPDRPNLVLFDIQPDQEAAVRRLLKERGAPLLQQAPIVAGRLAELNGRPVGELRSDSGPARPVGWAVRREYRNTYRDTLVASERVVAGEWWETGGADGSQETGPELPRISMEEEIAADLRVGVGDHVTWDIQGVRIETRIANLRRVDWARFEPNFFVVFESGVLESAPRSVVLLSRLDDPEARARLQRDVIVRYPNVSALDLTLILNAVEVVLDRVTLAIRFMAIFTLAAGALILLGAVASSRFQRVRESLLLRTLGASTSTIRSILATEYLALGLLAGLAGTLLATAAGWALSRFLFELPFRLPSLPLLLLVLGTSVLTALIGLSTTRDVVHRPPLAGLRRWGE